jgi:hypothetical protein
MKCAMKLFTASLMLVISPTFILADDNGYGVRYDGGSVPNLKSGADLKLYIDSDSFRFVEKKETVLSVPGKAITEISYGQDVHRRVGAAIGLAVVSFGIGGLMALTKSKKHYVGVTYDDSGKKGGFALQCDKNNYRGILAGLEGISGKRAVDASTMTVKN